MELFKDVVIKLTGEVQATGCHSTDEDRLENLEELCMLAEDVVYELIQASRTRDEYRISMQDIGNKAAIALGDIAAMIEEELGE